MSNSIGKVGHNVSDNLSKVLSFKLPQPSIKPAAHFYDSCKVGAALDIDVDDNIPLRIMLLLLDEAFDLKNKNQWLRRPIVTSLRQLIKATMGDMINKKIVDQVQLLTSTVQVSEYVKTFRDSFWPNGILAEPRPKRNVNTVMRTRIVAKAKMLGSVPDELRHLLGNETSRNGIERVFQMFQHPELNRRLFYVILEGFLEMLFPDNKFPELYEKLYSRSTRLKHNPQSTAAAGKDENNSSNSNNSTARSAKR